MEYGRNIKNAAFVVVASKMQFQRSFPTFDASRGYVRNGKERKATTQRISSTCQRASSFVYRVRLDSNTDLGIFQILCPYNVNSGYTLCIHASHTVYYIHLYITQARKQGLDIITVASVFCLYLLLFLPSPFVAQLLLLSLVVVLKALLESVALHPQ
jgi:hypothetical protein